MTAARFLNVIHRNPVNAAVLARLGDLPFETWLTSGSLVQTVWNIAAGWDAAAHIGDYDLMYLDPDTSWEAEDTVIRQAARLFADLPVTVQIRNQARVPIWYEAKYGLRYPPVRKAQHAVLRFPTKTSAIAVTRDADGTDRLYAPFGVGYALDGKVRPNRRLDIPGVYREKAAKWRAIWPFLDVADW